MVEQSQRKKMWHSPQSEAYYYRQASPMLNQPVLALAIVDSNSWSIDTPSTDSFED